MSKNIPMGVLGQSAGGAVTPLPTTNLIALYDPELGVTLSGSNVTNWADQSGVGRDLAQVTAVNQPLFNSANATMNGKPTVDFDGSDWMDDTFGSISQPVHIFMAVITKAWVLSAYYLAASIGSSVGLQQFGTSPQIATIDSAARSPSFGGTTVDGSSSNLIEGYINAASSFTGVDGVLSGTGGGGTAPLSNGIRLMSEGSAAVTGDIGLVAVYSAQKITTELADIYAHFNDRFVIF